MAVLEEERFEGRGGGKERGVQRRVGALCEGGRGGKRCDGGKWGEDPKKGGYNGMGKRGEEEREGGNQRERV